MLKFFVEDDSIEVTELPVPNSGRVEKKLVRRHRIRKPGMHRGTDNDGFRATDGNATTTSQDTPAELYYGADDLYPGSVIHAGGMDFREWPTVRVCVSVYVCGCVGE